MDKKNEMIVHEAFIRRASMLNEPFMLKGSYLTRQYFSNPSDRLTNDLDWLCLEKFDDADDASIALENWAKRVLEIDLHDGVKFLNFADTTFQGAFSYAMPDDFPTYNAEVLAWFNDEEFKFSLDVSFNLNLPLAPISMLYQPVQGEPFVIEKTAPLPLQISWKLHEVILRLRFKDLFDLVHLLKHPTFNAEMREQTLNALVHECRTVNTNLERLNFIIEGNLKDLYKLFPLKNEWISWRTGQYISGNRSNYFPATNAKDITNPNNLPVDLETFEIELRKAFEQADFSAEIVKNCLKQ